MGGLISYQNSDGLWVRIRSGRFPVPLPQPISGSSSGLTSTVWPQRARVDCRFGSRWTGRRSAGRSEPCSRWCPAGASPRGRLEGDSFSHISRLPRRAQEVHTWQMTSKHLLYVKEQTETDRHFREPVEQCNERTVKSEHVGFTLFCFVICWTLSTSDQMSAFSNKSTRLNQKPSMWNLVHQSLTCPPPPSPPPCPRLLLRLTRASSQYCAQLQRAVICILRSMQYSLVHS